MEFNQAQNEQNKDEETMLRDFIQQEVGTYIQNMASSSGNEAFYRQQAYIDTLVKVQSIEHNVHAELTEAIEKLKDLTYA